MRQEQRNHRASENAETESRKIPALTRKYCRIARPVTSVISVKTVIFAFLSKMTEMTDLTGKVFSNFDRSDGKDFSA